ncbi:hypothetical protein ACIRVK_00405 [Streptomyces sp. NPDC101152]|uniref:hypothetical protein n=1 Tax=Streptomyces sp. NPDC101152 TaxID=3366116 RepID=UPI0037FF7212
MSIIHAMVRCILDLFAPGTGTRRASAHPAQKAPAPAPDSPHPPAVPLPTHRSPYGLPVALDGRAATLVRPYVVAAEREHAQLRRRIALVLAADFGIDLDRHVLGAGGMT